MHYLFGTTFPCVIILTLFRGRDGAKSENGIRLGKAPQEYSLLDVIPEKSKPDPTKSSRTNLFGRNDDESADDEENYKEIYRINSFKERIFSPVVGRNAHGDHEISTATDGDIPDTLRLYQTTIDDNVLSTTDIKPSLGDEPTSSTEYSPYFKQVSGGSGPTVSTRYTPLFEQAWSETYPSVPTEYYPYFKPILEETSQTAAIKYSPYVEQRMVPEKTRETTQQSSPWTVFTEVSHPYKVVEESILQGSGIKDAPEFRVAHAAVPQSDMATENRIKPNEMLPLEDFAAKTKSPLHPTQKTSPPKNEKFPTDDFEKVYSTFSKIHIKTQLNKSSSTTLETYFSLNDGAQNRPRNEIFMPFTASYSETSRNLNSNVEPSQTELKPLHNNTAEERNSSTDSIKTYSYLNTTPNKLFTDQLGLESHKENLGTRPSTTGIDIGNAPSIHDMNNFPVGVGQLTNNKQISDLSNEKSVMAVPNNAFLLPENTLKGTKEDSKSKPEFSSHTYEEGKLSISDNINRSEENNPSGSNVMSDDEEYTADFSDNSYLYGQPDNCLSSHETCLWQALQQNSYRETCLCSEKCKEIGNCCLDYPLGPISFNTHKEKQWSCAKVHNNVGYLVISSCPMNWPNGQVKLQCEDITDSEYDKFGNVPVSSKSTSLTYRNLHCAICNGDLDFESWRTQFYCPYSINRNKLIANDAAINDCETGFSRPPSLHIRDTLKNNNPRLLTRCDFTLVSDCPENWKRNVVDEYALIIWTKCLLLHAPITKWEYDKVVKYKNMFCALCHGISNVKSLCPNVFQGPSEIPQYMPGKPALSLLLDMDFTQGGMIVGSQERCPEMYLYDPWMRGCRHVMCGKHYIYENGYCFLRVESFNQNISEQTISTANDSLYSNCLRVAYTSNEFLLFENGSIFLNNGDTFLQPNQYEMVDNQTIGVCVGDSMMKYVETFSNVQGFLTIAGINMSILALFIKICCYLFSKERNKLPSKIVLFLSISLLSAQTLFLFGITRTNYHVLCIIIGLLIHYFFLSTFFWMNVLAYDIWKTFSSCKSVKTFQPEKQLLKYCLYGWLAPFSIVFCSIMANWVFNNPALNPSYGVALCWITNKVALVVFFGAPIAVLLHINAYFFVVTAIAIRKTTIASKFALENSNSCGDRVQFGLYCKLACIMGLTWIFGFVAAFSGSIVLWYFFIIFNSIQGVYVFVAFTHFRCPKWLKVGNIKDLISRHTTISNTSLTNSSSVSKI